MAGMYCGAFSQSFPFVQNYLIFVFPGVLHTFGLFCQKKPSTWWWMAEIVHRLGPQIYRSFRCVGYGRDAVCPPSSR